MATNRRPGYRALRKGRYSQPNGIYLVTTVTDQRIPWFQVFSFAHLMCRCLVHPGNLGDARLLCWVVMPDHLHLLIELAETPLPSALNRLKSKSAIALNREIGRQGRFWQPGFHDHALRAEEELLDVARYIVANPLRAGLARRYADYPFWDAVWL